MSILFNLKKEQQQLMPLFDGAFIENKPIPFPENRTTQAYSNLFYWAHLEANETSEFPLHFHKGFEIMTFVFKGSVEHFDTASNIYTPLNAGDMQVIQANSGVQHSERITKGTELFQIWFDPDCSKSFKKEPSCKDYSKDSFKSEEIDGIKRVFYLKQKEPIEYITKDIDIEKLSFDVGKYIETLDKHYMYSYYLLDGKVKLNDEVVQKDGFIVLYNLESVNIAVYKDAELFVIKTPLNIEYKRFIDRY